MDWVILTARISFTVMHGSVLEAAAIIMIACIEELTHYLKRRRLPMQFGTAGSIPEIRGTTTKMNIFLLSVDTKN